MVSRAQIGTIVALGFVFGAGCDTRRGQGLGEVVVQRVERFDAEEAGYYEEFGIPYRTASACARDIWESVGGGDFKDDGKPGGEPPHEQKDQVILQKRVGNLKTL